MPPRSAASVDWNRSGGAASPERKGDKKKRRRPLPLPAAAEGTATAGCRLLFCRHGHLPMDRAKGYWFPHIRTRRSDTR